MDKTKMAVEVFNKRANVYQDKFMNVDLYGDTFDLFCNSIPKPDAEILELACGPGNITRHLLNKRPHFKILGIDLAPNMIGLARINNPEAEFQVMDCRDISTIGRKYDAIMCGFCLPYLSKKDAVKLIGDASGLLNPHGVFYLSTMEENDDNKSGLRISSSRDSVYIHYHRSDYLTDALKENDFKIIDLCRQDYPTNDATKTIDLIIIAQKQ